VSDSGISWAICKSAPRSRQVTMPAPHHSVFYRPDALPAAQRTASKHWRHIIYPVYCYYDIQNEQNPHWNLGFFQSVPHQQNLGLYWQFPVLSVCLSTVFSVANFQNFIIRDFMVDFPASMMWKCLLDLIDRLFMPCYTCNAEAEINTTHS